jgi:hypothetical protein
MNQTNFKQVVDHISAHPETHDQGRWHFGTKHCFAGLAQLMAGHEADAMKCPKQARDWLELTVWQAMYLFDAARTLQDFTDWQGMTDEQRLSINY